MNTKHATVRAQQRGIPPIVDELLDRYGREEHVGHGAVWIYFDKISIRNMKSDWGCRVVKQFTGWLNAYKVKGLDGRTITIGHRTGRVRRK